MKYLFTDEQFGGETEQFSDIELDTGKG
jgi:hypothetical protein